MGIRLATNETKTRVLENLENKFRAQERILTQSVEGFDYARALQELR